MDQLFIAAVFSIEANRYTCAHVVSGIDYYWSSATKDVYVSGLQVSGYF